MSNFEGYSKLRNNVFNLTDDEIKKYYFEAEKEIDSGNGIGYYLHVPRTNKDFMNKNFLAESSLDIVNKYLSKKYKKITIN